MTGLRILFVKESQNWPRASGHDVHAYHLMKALAVRGHSISLATIVPPSESALEGLTLASYHSLNLAHETRNTEKKAVPSSELQVLSPSLPLTRFQRRFANYYGVSDSHGIALGRILREREFDAVVVVARHLLPLLSAILKQQHGSNGGITDGGKLTGIRDESSWSPVPCPLSPLRIWYPADDPAWHHLSRVRVGSARTWGELRTAAVNVLYERAFRSCYDRVWVVSPPDRRAVRVFSGCRAVDVVPNGVDADYYRPQSAPDLPVSCVFWGRLDFDPNVDALEWFVGRIWPVVMKRTPAARLSLFGFNPRPRVIELAKAAGIELHADVPDLRAEVARREVVVLPFVSGGGIKNKLLEAAALGMPIVCTRRALCGTKGQPAVKVCGSASEWAETLAGLWADPAARSALGSAVRKWVTEHHTWDAAARTAEEAIAFRGCRGSKPRPKNRRG